MKRVGVALAATSVLLAPACGFSGSQAEKRPVIDASVLPDRLPEDILQLSKNIVRVTIARSDPETGMREQTGGGYGSGVALDHTTVLTAGHVLYSEQHTMIGPVPLPMTRRTVRNPGTEFCGDVNVESTSRQAAGDKYGALTEVRSYSGKYQSSPNKADAAVLKLNGQLPVDIGRVSIRNTPLEPGEPVYFINFQPDSAGKPRTPHEMNLKDEEIRGGYAKPAIYGGLVMRKYGSESVAVATNIRSYGAVEDITARPGASGGAVFDNQLRLVGIARVTSGLRVAQAIENRHKVNFVKELDDSIVASTIIQVVDDALLSELQAGMATAQHCKV